MPVTKSILKNSKRQAVVKLVGTGLGYINVHELAAVVGPNAISDVQTVSTANLELTISDLFYDVSAASNITRNSNVIWAMNGGSADYAFSRDIGVVLNQDANANVLVNIGGTANGTVLIQFTKGAGYNDPYDLQIQGPGVGRI